ncbi:MAG: nicotinate phosphoribosyltransferase, partial [Propionibacteriaceae bacterium]|nr:nicotinate phosphoribosyltransferase [Propionibacteriaceae bacterium]
LESRANDDGVMEGVAKASKDKSSVGGRKYALRRRNSAGVATAEIIGINEQPDDDGDDRQLLVPLVQDGEVVAATDAQTARAQHEMARAELPGRALRLSHGEAAIPTQYLDDWS